MAALRAEVPYILYEGHVPPSFREIHVPSEKARPNVRVWPFLAGNDKASPLVKFWRESGKAHEKFLNLVLSVSFNLWSLYSVSVILALVMKQFLRSKQFLLLFYQEQCSVKRNSLFPRFR